MVKTPQILDFRFWTRIRHLATTDPFPTVRRGSPDPAVPADHRSPWASMAEARTGNLSVGNAAGSGDPRRTGVGNAAGSGDPRRTGTYRSGTRRGRETRAERESGTRRGRETRAEREPIGRERGGVGRPAPNEWN